jgi:hypothetical protein
VPDSAECCCATPQTQVCLRVGLCSQPCEQPEGRGRGRLAGGRAYQHAQQHQLEHWVGGTHGPVTAAPSLLRVESTRLISFVSRDRVAASTAPAPPCRARRRCLLRTMWRTPPCPPTSASSKTSRSCTRAGRAQGVTPPPTHRDATRRDIRMAKPTHATLPLTVDAARETLRSLPSLGGALTGVMADGRGRVDGAEGRLRRPARQLALPLPSQARTFPATFPNPIDLSTVLRKRPRR